MAYLAGVGTESGRYEYAQETITDAFADLVLGANASKSQHDLVERIHAATGVRIVSLRCRSTSTPSSPDSAQRTTCSSTWASRWLSGLHARRLLPPVSLLLTSTTS